MYITIPKRKILSMVLYIYYYKKCSIFDTYYIQYHNKLFSSDANILIWFSKTLTIPSKT